MYRRSLAAPTRSFARRERVRRAFAVGALVATLACGGDSPVEPTPPEQLVITGAGGGSAVIVSSPAGIDCDIANGTATGDCDAEFAFGSTVTLSITPATGTFFESWGGACSGRAPCSVIMSQPRAVVATLAPNGGGGELVLLADVNYFDTQAMDTPGNKQFVANLVTYRHAGPRGTGTGVRIDCGRQAPAAVSCPGLLADFIEALADSGYQAEIFSSSTGTLTSVPANVKLVMLTVPCQAFTAPEVTALKDFAADGGRILLISETDLVVESTCAAVHNDLAADLGTPLSRAADQHNCGYNTLPAASLRPHQITEGVESITMACSASVSTTTEGWPLIFDSTNQTLLAAVGLIDTD